MTSPIITVESISKRYVIGHQRDSSNGLRHRLEAAFRAPWRWLKQRQIERRATKEDFWALRDVSFEINAGEAVGIIGRNGAGKSTLLKILSRITEPTTGRITLRGKVASLLEVGTGFHQELTGRENIFLNGAILGMSKAEIKRKFDEIVAFSEVEKFLDTPVKHYSSGMYVRLAFAVAAHMEPEILIVDEVLAVGDAQFQKKCLGKMQDVSFKEGRTVLFVSHSMSAITRLCSKAILLNGGRLTHTGTAREVVSQYHEGGMRRASQKVWENSDLAPGGDVAKLRAVRLLDSSGAQTGIVEIGSPCAIEIEYECGKDKLGASNRLPIPAIQLINESGLVIFASADFERSRKSSNGSTDRKVRARCTIPAGLLAEGHFSILAAIVNYNPDLVHAIAPDAIFFQAVEGGKYSTRGDCSTEWPGLVRPQLVWE